MELLINGDMKSTPAILYFVCFVGDGAGGPGHVGDGAQVRDGGYAAQEWRDGDNNYLVSY